MQSRFPTRLAMVSNGVVLVGATNKLVDVVKQAAFSASGGGVFLTDIAGAATLCAEVRPYAIVIPEEVYWFGGAEFDALARDVDAGLVVVPPTIQMAVLSASLLDEAARLG
ncbi:MAG: hypothetical protein U0271_31020 [Polyangiaceae bacterium]